MTGSLFPTVGDVVAVAVWVAFAGVLYAGWRHHRRPRPLHRVDLSPRPIARGPRVCPGDRTDWLRDLADEHLEGML